MAMNITLYTVIGDFGRVREAILKHFSDVLERVEPLEDEANEDAFRLVFHDNTWLKIYVKHQKSFIREHIRGMYQFFAQAPMENQELLGNILNQIRVFNCVTGCEFETDENEQRTNYIINSLFFAAQDINAFLLFPAMALLTNEGKLLISIEGKSDFTSYSPVGNADFLDYGKEESPEDMARKERSIGRLKEKEIPCLPHLRAAVMEEDAKVRSAKEIGERLFAMFGVCVYSEALHCGETPAEAKKYLNRVDEMLSGRLLECMTPEERAYTEMEEPDERLMTKFSWRYEGCLVLLWALDYVGELPYPGEICNVSQIAEILWGQDSLEEFLEHAYRREDRVILDEADLILRMDWACVDARIHEKEAPGGLDAGVVYERHYAFNWLIGANGNADWDDISPDT